MTKKIGFKFRPNWPSEIDYFEVRGLDPSRKMVLTTVYPKSGNPFKDEIEEEYYDAAFLVGEYKPLPDNEED